MHNFNNLQLFVAIENIFTRQTWTFCVGGASRSLTNSTIYCHTHILLPVRYEYFNIPKQASVSEVPDDT